MPPGTECVGAGTLTTWRAASVGSTAGGAALGACLSFSVMLNVAFDTATGGAGSCGAGGGALVEDFQWTHSMSGSGGSAHIHSIAAVMCLQEAPCRWPGQEHLKPR